MCGLAHSTDLCAVMLLARRCLPGGWQSQAFQSAGFAGVAPPYYEQYEQPWAYYPALEQPVPHYAHADPGVAAVYGIHMNPPTYRAAAHDSPPHAPRDDEVGAGGGAGGEFATKGYRRAERGQAKKRGVVRRRGPRDAHAASSPPKPLDSGGTRGTQRVQQPRDARTKRGKSQPRGKRRKQRSCAPRGTHNGTAGDGAGAFPGSDEEWTPTTSRKQRSFKKPNKHTTGQRTGRRAKQKAPASADRTRGAPDPPAQSPVAVTSVGWGTAQPVDESASVAAARSTSPPAINILVPRRKAASAAASPAPPKRRRLRPQPVSAAEARAYNGERVWRMRGSGLHG